MRFEIARKKMVQQQIMARGIDDYKILEAMLKVPRHEFIDSALGIQAYGDNALPIGEGQTISQPYVVAYMTRALKLNSTHKILEIGTGSGYQTAVLYAFSRQITTIERCEGLFAKTAKRFITTGMDSVVNILGDGTKGYLPNAPYDRIIVTAGAPVIPDSLYNQLAEGGRLIIPVGSLDLQQLFIVEKINGVRKETKEMGCKFVPLKGQEGW